MTFRIPIKKIILAGLFQIAGAALTAQVTLEECVGMAQENYPLVRKYNLLQQTEEIELSDINKGWLPQIGVYGQGTFQNAVPGFPEQPTISGKHPWTWNSTRSGNGLRICFSVFS